MGKSKKKGEPKNNARTLEGAMDGFDLDTPVLPDIIADAALTSDDYPYHKEMKRKTYEKELLLLQIELAKVQVWMRETGGRFVIIFEGRDAAGKGSAILRFTQHLNPRSARIVALSKPTETEIGQWYFQRYVDYLPTKGEMVIFDRSWYNRAGVERVMGFCTEQQVDDFFAEVPRFEHMLARDGIRVYKYWLTIGRPTQLKRFHERRHDPLKQWKISPIDLAALGKWNEYTAAKEDMFRHTHTATTPWTVVRANDKKRTRLNVIRHFLQDLDYKDKNIDAIGVPDEKIVGSGDPFFYSN